MSLSFYDIVSIINLNVAINIEDRLGGEHWKSLVAEPFE
jgi:hypothetical protein